MHEHEKPVLTDAIVLHQLSHQRFCKHGCIGGLRKKTQARQAMLNKAVEKEAQNDSDAFSNVRDPIKYNTDERILR